MAVGKGRRPPRHRPPQLRRSDHPPLAFPPPPQPLSVRVTATMPRHLPPPLLSLLVLVALCPLCPLPLCAPCASFPSIPSPPPVCRSSPHSITIRRRVDCLETCGLRAVSSQREEEEEEGGEEERGARAGGASSGLMRGAGGTNVCDFADTGGQCDRSAGSNSDPANTFLPDLRRRACSINNSPSFRRDRRTQLS